MFRNDNLYENLKTELRSNNPVVRSSAVESLFNENLNDVIIEDICSMVEDPDKGVRNTVDLMLSINPSPHIPEHLIKYISSPDISTRNLAGEILLKIGGNSVNAMLDYLLIGDDDDKKFIIDILGLIGDSKAAPVIIELLKTGGNENLILSCIEALGNLSYKLAVNVLIRVYETNELFKPTVIEALGKIGTAKVLDFIISKYSKEDDLTKFAMIESLGLIGNEDTFYFLISELIKTTGPLVWSLIESIYFLRGKYNLDVPYDEQMKNSILQTIEEGDSRYKKAAVNLAVEFEGEDIIYACMNIYGEDFETDKLIKPKIQENPERFFKLLLSILNTGSNNLKNMLELAVEMLNRNDINFKDFLSDLDERNLAGFMIQDLDNPGEEIRKSSMEILFTIDKEKALMFLDKMLEDDSIWNRLRLLEILSGIYDYQAEEAISKLAQDPEEMISERAKFILSNNLDVQL